MRQTIAAVVTATACLGFAQSALADSPNPDPFERFNRRNYAINAALDKALIRPLSIVTHGLTPGPIGKAIHNVLETLNQPVVILNDLLQARPKAAAKSVARLAVNVTVGLLGTADVAVKLGLPHHPNGFGDTLGRYGVKPGPYLYLPLAGPFTVRDLFGTGVDAVSTPIFFVRYAYKNDVLIALNVVGGLNQRADVAAELDALLSDAADPYATLRATYLQAREGEIRGDQPSPVLPDIGPADPIPAIPAVEAKDTPPADPSSPAAAAPPAPATPAAPAPPTGSPGPS